MGLGVDPGPRHGVLPEMAGSLDELPRPRGRKMREPAQRMQRSVAQPGPRHRQQGLRIGMFDPVDPGRDATGGAREQAR